MIINFSKMIIAPLLFNFCFKICHIRKIQENHVGLKLNGALHLLAYAHDLNLLEDKI
jgi:hypothetical protein